MKSLLSLIERVLVVGTYAALMLMMVLISVDAAVRYLFRATLPDVYHFTELYLMPAVVFFALANTQRLRGHVAVTLLDKVLPRVLRRVILTATYLAAGICFALVTWRVFGPALSDIQRWRTTAGVVPWPTGISRMIVPIGCSVLSLRLFVDAVATVLGEHDPEADAEGATR
ncbi:TRAP transporter small permease [Paracoccus jeotgali]|uniref:TRAP transporter small permease n=1 Tax=Paracoccus jeotgali TaxID=2065379 RepID=UPI0028A7A29B|nr:TRAP transporter small permease [Paracoccus jeotgali]